MYYIATYSGSKCPVEYNANCGGQYIEEEIPGHWKDTKGRRSYFGTPRFSRHVLLGGAGIC